MTTSDEGGRQALHYAALHDHAAEVRALLASGADPDAADLGGFTPLHFACQQGSLASAQLLIEAGVDVDRPDSFGNTPLFVAVFNSGGRGDVIELLRSHGADPHRANHAGQSPIGLAMLIASFDVARFLGDADAGRDDRRPRRFLVEEASFQELPELNALVCAFRESDAVGGSLELSRSLVVDEQDRRLEQDTYSLSVDGGPTVYGGLRAWAVSGSVAVFELDARTAAVLRIENDFVLDLTNVHGALDDIWAGMARILGS
jgi:ankyrin repeat protein